MREQVMSHHLEKSPIMSAGHVDQVKYTIASDPKLISQYYNLLERVYRKCFLSTFTVSVQEHLYNNMHGLIIVAINSKGRVISGARLITSTPGFPCELPLENDCFQLKKYFPNYNLNKCTYSEWGRFVIDNNVLNKSEVTESLARVCVKLAVELGSKFLFGLPTLFMKNRYQYIFNNMGLNFQEIISASQMPKHPLFKNVALYLAVADLSDIQRSQNNFINK